MKTENILIAFLIVTFTSITFAAPSAKEILKKVQKKYEKDIKTLSADFTQKVQWNLSGFVQESEGKMLLKGNKFRFDTNSQSLSNDGETIWTYNSSSEQIIIDSIKKSGEILLPQELLFKFPDNYTIFYLGEEKQGKNNFYILKLAAKSETENLKEIKVWVSEDKWLTQKLEYVDLNENITTYTLKNVKTNIEILDSKFQLTEFADAEIIDLREE